MSSKVKPYNFARPGRLPGDLEQRLAGWLKGSFTLGPRRWPKILPYPIEMSIRELSGFPTAIALEQVPETSLSFRVSSHPDFGTSLFVAPRPLILGLVAGLLGETPSALAEDRDLTSVEEALGEHLFQTIWFPVLQETWPQSEPLSLSLKQKDSNPRYTRIFAPDIPIVVCAIQVKGPFGEQDWLWRIPQKGLAGHLLPPKPPAQDVGAPQPPPRERLEVYAKDFAVDLAVTLGSVELPLSHVSKLRVGDVVVLDQKCGAPLPASVDGKKKFLGWPGRMAFRQAFQIQSLLEG